jgi:hypothetical protein
MAGRPQNPSSQNANKKRFGKRCLVYPRLNRMDL